MKILKIKRPGNNSSFVTNQDLLECLRSNKSFVASRQNSTRLNSNSSKVSLIQKKKYDRILTQENDSFAVNAPSQFTPPAADRAIILLQDCLATIADSNPTITHKLKKVIAYVRESKEQEAKKEQAVKQIQRQGQRALLRKLESICQEKAVLKLQNEELKVKLSEYRQKISNMRRQGKAVQVAKVGSGLQELVINQSHLIDKQCEQSRQESEQLRRMMHVQALKIEQMMRKEFNTHKQVPVARQPSIVREAKMRPPSTLRF